MHHPKVKYLSVLVIIMLGLLTACGLGKPQTPTIDPSLLITQVFQTVEAELTSTAAAMPTTTFTPEPSSTPTMTATPAITTTPLGTLPGIPPIGIGQPTVSADNAEFVADVTVPDNSQILPKTEFTKTWRIKNIGTTTWNANYKLVYLDGVSISMVEAVLKVTEVKLTSEVKPGAEVEISVPMVSPSKNGTYKIWWKMLNPQGYFFGEPLYVQIVVGATTVTVVPTATP
jgi:Ig-like domain from next to BRCA1 gene